MKDKHLFRVLLAMGCGFLLAASARGQTTCTHSSAGYTSPGTCTVNIQFTRQADKTLAAFVYYVTLPSGWDVISVSGDGSPEYSPFDNGIVLLGSLASLQPRPLNISFTMSVPAGETGPKNLSGLVEYTYADTSTPVAIAVTPDPLAISAAVSGAPEFTGLQSTGGTIVLQWTATNSGSYRLQSSPALVPVAWSNVPGLAPIPGASGIMSATDTNAAQRKFYRVLWTY